MSYFLEVPLRNGEVVLAEITGQVDDVAPFGRGKEVLGRLSGTFAEGLDQVSSFASEALECLKKAAEPPDRVAVEFGIKFSAKGGMVVAEMAGEGHVAVTVEWHRPTASEPVRTSASKPVPESGG